MKRAATVGGIGILAAAGIALAGVYLIPYVALWVVYLVVLIIGAR